MRDVLLAYEAHVRQQTLEEYRVRRLEFAVLAPWGSKKMKPPKLPAILKDQ